MRNSLGRIERDYVLEELKTACPPLVVQCGLFHLSIPAASYRCDGERLTFADDFSVGPRATVRVFFPHRERGLFFDSSALRLPGGAGWQVLIPNSIYKAASAPASDMSADIIGTGGITRCVPLADFAPDLVVLNPETLAHRRSAIQKLCARLGLGAEADIAAYRVLELIEWLRTEASSALATTGVFLYIDHRHLIVAVGNLLSDELPPDAAVRLRCAYRKRHFEASASIVGVLRLNDVQTVIAFDLASLQEENKRLLFESVYGIKYQ